MNEKHFIEISYFVLKNIVLLQKKLKNVLNTQRKIIRKIFIKIHFE